MYSLSLSLSLSPFPSPLFLPRLFQKIPPTGPFPPPLFLSLISFKRYPLLDPISIVLQVDHIRAKVQGEPPPRDVLPPPNKVGFYSQLMSIILIIILCVSWLHVSVSTLHSSLRLLMADTPVCVCVRDLRVIDYRIWTVEIVTNSRPAAVSQCASRTEKAAAVIRDLCMYVYLVI